MLHINGLVQERRNSSANALEFRLSCTNPLICMLTMSQGKPASAQMKAVMIEACVFGYVWVCLLSNGTFSAVCIV